MAGAGSALDQNDYRVLEGIERQPERIADAFEGEDEDE